MRTIKIYVYTDASTENGYGVAISLILGDEKFLGKVEKSYRSGRASLTEVLAVLQSIEFLKENNYGREDIEIYTDLESITKIYNRLNNGSKIESLEFKNIWEKIIKKSEGMNISIFHIDSHQVCMNPNTTCDRWSYYLLRHRLLEKR